MLHIAVAADHGGFPLKADLIRLAESLGCRVTDLGAYQYEALDDYPDFAIKAARAVQKGDVDRAIVLCGSGVGACVVANKVRGVRAGICHDTYSAHQGVEHDNMNVLCLGARIIGSGSGRRGGARAAGAAPAGSPGRLPGARASRRRSRDGAADGAAAARTSGRGTRAVTASRSPDGVARAPSGRSSGWAVVAGCRDLAWAAAGRTGAGRMG